MPKIVGTRESIHQPFYRLLDRIASDKAELAQLKAAAQRRVCAFCRASNTGESRRCSHCGAPT